MAYKTEELYKQAMEIVQDDGIHFIEDVICQLPCSKFAFYDHFPTDSNEYNNIKAQIDKNRNKTKADIRRKLKEGRGGELIALYKLLATREENEALNSQYNTNVNKHQIDDLSGMSTEELERRAAALEKLDES